MTLVLAVKAADGVVLAADGQATTVSSAPTRVPTRKLGALQGRIAYGCSGSAGLRQRIIAALESDLTETDCYQPLSEIRPRIFKVVNDLQHQALAEHVALPNSFPAHAQFLFAGHTGEQPWIYEIGPTGEEQEHHRAEAIGESGHFAAYGLIQHNHYRLVERRVEHVRILVFRILANAILTDASGSVGVGDIQLYQVDVDGAHELTLDEMKAMADTLGTWQEQEADIFERAFSAGQVTADQGLAKDDSAEPAEGVRLG